MVNFKSWASLSQSKLISFSEQNKSESNFGTEFFWADLSQAELVPVLIKINIHSELIWANLSWAGLVLITHCLGLSDTLLPMVEFLPEGMSVYWGNEQTEGSCNSNLTATRPQDYVEIWQSFQVHITSYMEAGLMTRSSKLIFRNIWFHYRVSYC